MGSRSTGRKLAMQLLYQAELRNKTLEEVTETIKEDSNYPIPTRKFAITLALNTWEVRKKLDQCIDQLAIDWDIDRISIVDKNILRLAIYELQEYKTPQNVILNEAIELAKQFSSEDASRFINGILGKLIKEN